MHGWICTYRGCVQFPMDWREHSRPSHVFKKPRQSSENEEALPPPLPMMEGSLIHSLIPSEWTGGGVQQPNFCSILKISNNVFILGFTPQLQILVQPSHSLKWGLCSHPTHSSLTEANWSRDEIMKGGSDKFQWLSSLLAKRLKIMSEPKSGRDLKMRNDVKVIQDT